MWEHLWSTYFQQGTMVLKQINGGRTVFSINGAEMTEYSCKRMKWKSTLHHIQILTH